MRAAWAIVAVVVLLAVVLLIVFSWRLRAIASRVGSFECALRSGSRWLPGIATYTHEALVWYDVVSLSRHPRHRWARGELVILDRSARPDAPAGRVVVEAHCSVQGAPLEIAAEPAALDGLVSWLEAAPPGARSSGVI